MSLPKLRKRTRTGRLSATDISRLQEVPVLRNRALRAVTANFSHLFVSAKLHKEVITFLFTSYLTSSGTEDQIALEFWGVYRHIAEGHPVLEFPFKLIDPTTTVSRLRRIINGERTDFQREEEETTDE